jgi:hypothetical protein
MNLEGSRIFTYDLSLIQLNTLMYTLTLVCVLRLYLISTLHRFILAIYILGLFFCEQSFIMFKEITIATFVFAKAKQGKGSAH